MAGYTKFTNVEIIGELKVNGKEMKQGVAVADAAGTAPTAAEFKALLDALREAGIIAES